MYLPENPDKRPELWESFAHHALTDRDCYLVASGEGHRAAKAKCLAEEEVQNLLLRFRQADIQRIGARHGKLAVCFDDWPAAYADI